MAPDPPKAEVAVRASAAFSSVNICASWSFKARAGDGGAAGGFERPKTIPRIPETRPKTALTAGAGEVRAAAAPKAPLTAPKIFASPGKGASPKSEEILSTPSDWTKAELNRLVCID